MESQAERDRHPGSHDTASYGLDGSNWDYAGAQHQSEDITAALNQGIRMFDIRVRYAAYGPPAGTDYWGNHNDYVSTRLRFGQLLDQVRDWTLTPGHEQEIILLGLLIETEGAAYPTDTCQDFTSALGGAWLTPRALQDAFGTSDPGQVTLGQLWSMPGQPRVLINDINCTREAPGSGGVGRWSPDPPFGSGGTSYYANQCYADSYIGYPGVWDRVHTAAQHRYIAVDPTDGTQPESFGPPMVGGIWTLFVQGTTTATCGFPLNWFSLKTTNDVLARLWTAWQNNDGNGALRETLNVIAGDYVESTDIVKIAIEMNQTWPIVPATIARTGPEQIVAVQGQEGIPGESFAAFMGYEGTPASDRQVTYQVTNWTAGGPTFGGGGSTATTVSSAAGLVQPPPVNAGSLPGTWTLTGTEGGVPVLSTSWTLVVQPSTDNTLEPVAGSPTTVQVTQTVSGFAVRAVDAGSGGGGPVEGVAVTFDATPAGGTFANGQETATVTTDVDGIARAPALTAGTRAGARSIVASSATSPHLSLPLTVTGGDPATFVPVTGNVQTTPINTTFPIPLTGYYLDQYGNVVTGDVLSDWSVFSLGGTTPVIWPNGSGITFVTPAADGTFTLSPLSARSKVGDLVVFTAPAGPFDFFLRIAPGPPHAVTATGGNGQQAAAGQPFAQPLAVRVTDAEGNPIPGTPVTFQVTSGSATFPPLDLALLAAITGRPASDQPNPPRVSVMVPTDANGIATAPVLTAGQGPGQIFVTASALGAPAGPNAVFVLAVVSGTSTAPSNTNPAVDAGSGPAVGDEGGTAVGPARLPNLRASASARWTGGSARVPASASAPWTDGLVRVRARVLAGNPGLVRRRVAVRVSIPALHVRKIVHVRRRGKRVRTLRVAFRAPAGVVGKRVHVVVDPAGLVDETNERDNAAHVRIR